MAEVKWIKVSTNLFDNRKIKLIRKMPDGDALIGIWLQILCVAGNINDGGAVYFTTDIPYTDEMLAGEFDRPLNTIRLALETFVRFGMIEIVDSIVFVSNWEKYQNIDALSKMRENARKRVAAYRERKALPEVTPQCNVTDRNIVTLRNATDIDKKEDKEIDKEGDKEEDVICGDLPTATPHPPSKPSKHQYGEYKNVMLTDAEYEKLQVAFPTDFQQRIERLSGYIESKGAKYKSHYATIKVWARKDASGGDANGFNPSGQYPQNNGLPKQTVLTGFKSADDE